MEWKTLETHGKPPDGRFHHCLHYFEQGNLLVVFGGRRFANPSATVHYDSEFIDEVGVLRLDTLNWHIV